MKLKDILSPTVRKWAYGVSVATTGYLGVKGLLASHEIASLNILLAAVFGMAFVNVPDSDPTEGAPGRHASADEAAEGPAGPA